MKFETLAIHAAREPDAATGALNTPLHLATTFQRDADGSYPRGWYYNRAGNPTRDTLEQAIAALEGGAGAAAFASGTQATLAAFSLLGPGDHILVGYDCYYGTLKQLRNIVNRMGVSHSEVDTTDLNAVAAAWTTRTRMIWLESPSNPQLRISDLEALADIAHARNALLACDNTLATPVLQRPFEHGADIVMHSTTKYFGGHSDVLGGAIVLRENGELLERLHQYQREGGGVAAPFDSWLILRSLATMPLRVRAQSASALAIAEFLAGDARVERVYYPGLADHPGHALAGRQMQAYGGMISVCVQGDKAAALEVAANTRLFTRATSLGGVESLIEHRASMEGPESKTPGNLLRLSIGLEHVDDLIEDLDQAL